MATSKTSLFLFAILAVIYTSQAAPVEQKGSKIDEIFYKVEEWVQYVQKKLVTPELDKEKFFAHLKADIDKWAHHFKDQLVKFEKEGLPKIGESVQKFSEIIQKNIEFLSDNLSSIARKIKDKEIQKKTEKLYESYAESVKKLGDDTSEVLKSVGYSKDIPDKIQSAGASIAEEVQKIANVIKEGVYSFKY